MLCIKPDGFIDTPLPIVEVAEKLLKDNGLGMYYFERRRLDVMNYK